MVSQISSVSSEALADAGPPLRDLGADKHVAAPSQVDGESNPVGALHGEVSPSGIPKVLDLEEKFLHADIPLSASSVAPASVSDASGEMTAAESMESTEDEESLLSREYILVGSLNHAEGSQVTHVF